MSEPAQTAVKKEIEDALPPYGAYIPTEDTTKIQYPIKDVVGETGVNAMETTSERHSQSRSAISELFRDASYT